MLLNKYQEYAHMLICALNLQKGQSMVITGESCHWPLMNLIAETAYRHGAKYVEVSAGNSGLLKARATYSESKYLDYATPTTVASQAIYIKEGWARLAISSQEDPHALRDVDDKKNMTIQASARRAQHKYREAIMSDKMNWLVCMAPTPKWAAQVLGGKAHHRNMHKLWNALIPILRLDAPDPAQALHQNCLNLNRRAEHLNALGIRVLHFQGPGTDLKIHLHPLARWKGGYSHTAKGIRFLPNLPTEEVFTTPDARYTEGHVTLSRPAVIFDKLVEGVELTFRKGKVVKYHARRGADVLDNFLKSDAQAPAVGEIALVDCNSPIYKSGKIFHNTLLDENSACHFAFGAAYPSCIEGGVTMSQSERKKIGINQSIVHNDVMIGNQSMSLVATLEGGTQKRIIENGSFCTE